MTLLADIILVLHALIIVFNVGGLAAIWIGAALQWRWIRNFWFRAIHLGLIGLVAAFSLFGMLCPLTAWEDALRRSAPAQTSFLQRWVGRLLYYNFYNFPPSFFTIAYVLFALLVLLTFILIKPARPSAGRR